MNVSLHRDFHDAQAANIAYLENQAAHIEATVYEIQYPDLDYASMIPVDTSANPWTKTVTYYSMDKSGAARFISGNGDDVPLVGLSTEQHNTNVYTAGIGYSYGLEEIEHARMVGVNLDNMKARAAIRASEEMIYDTAFYGQAEKGFEGLFNYTGVPVTAATTGTWATATPDEIIGDVNDLLIGVHSVTNTVAMADTLILPIERYQVLASKRLTDTSMTILEFLRTSNVYTATTGSPLTIRGMRKLLTAGAGSTARMIAYRRSPEVLKMHIPMPHRFLPLQIERLTYMYPGLFRIGGLDIRLPLEVRYGDGI
jgi:hypothetical protein